MNFHSFNIIPMKLANTKKAPTKYRALKVTSDINEPAIIPKGIVNVIPS